jgi:spore maturation protein CgeB
MRIVLFTHSLLSDWNHGNAHFLRGVASELSYRGHSVRCLEPANGWSLSNLLADHGEAAIQAFHAAYPRLKPVTYELDALDLDRELDDADIVLVHEWNDPELVRRIGLHRAERGRYTLYFHDTHHRAVTDPEALSRYDLQHYDAALVFGAVLRDVYLSRGWVKRVFTWHEAADNRCFYRRNAGALEGDLVWVGNFGDEERTAELTEFLIEPVQALGLKARVYGVRYPAAVLEKLERAGIEYGGYLPNFMAPQVYARFKLTLHVPRRPYTEQLPGIPTIRPFEALSCQIPLVSAPWRDAEHLFAVNRDFVMVDDGVRMKRAIERVLHDAVHADSLRSHGLRTILDRHTCAHRVSELLQLNRTLRAEPRPAPRSPQSSSVIV